MALAPYYTGDNVHLKFTITDESGDTYPTSAAISIIKPNNLVAGPYNVRVEGNEVSYAMLSTDTDLEGSYSAYFRVILLGDLARTHKIDFTVIKSP